MTTQVRRVATVMLVLFAALFANLNWLQVLRANELANHPDNRRLLVQEYEIRRGSIIAGDQQIAFSEATEGTLKYRRRYEPPTRYAHLLGYYSVVYGRAGLEAVLNETLIGTPAGLLAENLAQLLGQRDPVGNTVRLTIDPATQSVAQEALGGRPGAVVVLDASDGSVIAEVSTPAFDPNRLASHDTEEARAYWQRLNDDPARPLVDRTRIERFQPGSAFKVVVAAAALERGLTPGTSFQDRAEYTPPQTNRSISNFSPGPCAGGGTIDLTEALVVSCNTVFAELGVELGPDALVEQAERFGFNRRIPYVLPVSESVIPGDLDPPATAQSAIGARDVQATAMQMALVAAAISNGGVLMRPHVVAEVLDPSGRRIRGPDTGPWVDGPTTAQAMSEESAAALKEMMVEVVERGTGAAAQISGVRVGGKTGTADPGEGMPSHVWFIGFAETDGRRVAVAVVVPDAPAGSTGGRVAAPIARSVMETALRD